MNSWKKYMNYNNFEDYCNNKTWIFHWTHINNLGSILNFGYLYSRSYCSNEKLCNCDISNKEVQDRRSQKEIIINGNKKGNLHDFVPFYFSPNNIMFHYLKTNKEHDFDKTICFITTIQKLKQNDIEFYYSNKNASINGCIFYEKNTNIKDFIEENVFFEDPKTTGGYCKYYHSEEYNSCHHCQRAQKRQAECLIRNQFDIKLTEFVIARNDETFNLLQKKLQKNNSKIECLMEGGWND